MGYKLHWSEEAVANLEGILESLSKNWTNREIENFKKIAAAGFNYKKSIYVSGF